MVAVLGMDGPEVVKVCAQAAAATGEVVAAANFNEPKQTVIAGSKAGVAAASELLKAAGTKRLLPLAVSAPFHCALMKPAADRLKERLATTPIAAPRIAVVNNIDVAVETDPERIRDALFRQAFGPVRWVEVVQALRARGITQVVECGPGRVLAGMVKRIDAEMQTLALFDPDTLAECKAALS
jgi:[acyl-carrier-protein] S-malonyltransferase